MATTLEAVAGIVLIPFQERLLCLHSEHRRFLPTIRSVRDKLVSGVIDRVLLGGSSEEVRGRVAGKGSDVG